LLATSHSVGHNSVTYLLDYNGVLHRTAVPFQPNGRCMMAAAISASSLMRDVIVYSRRTLLSLRRNTGVTKFTFIHRIHQWNLLRYRGSRAGQQTRAYRDRVYVCGRDSACAVSHVGQIEIVFSSLNRTRPRPLQRPVRVLAMVTMAARQTPGTIGDTNVRPLDRTTSTTSDSHWLHCGLLNTRLLNNKSASVCDYIVSNRLDVFAAVETWHDDCSTPPLAQTYPPGYSILERARPRTAGAELLSMTVNHGGIAVFYKSVLRVSLFPLPAFTIIEVLALLINSCGHTMLLVTVYRPGSALVTHTHTSRFYGTATGETTPTSFPG
jgi:hypothetical protein